MTRGVSVVLRHDTAQLGTTLPYTRLCVSLFTEQRVAGVTLHQFSENMDNGYSSASDEENFELIAMLALKLKRKRRKKTILGYSTYVYFRDIENKWIIKISSRS